MGILSALSRLNHSNAHLLQEASLWLYNQMILGLLLSLVGHLASANTCSDLFVNTETPLYVMSRLTHIPSQPVIVGNEVRSYKVEDFLALRGKAVSFVVGNASAEKTQILFLQDLPKDRQSLVRLLWDLHNDPKYVKKSFVQDYVDEVARITNLSAGSDTRHSPQFIREYSMAGALRNKKNSVEVGAIIVNLRDGRSLTAQHTSSRYLRIEGDEVGKAINEILQKNGVELTDVTSIEYFHTHPDPSPLSVGDIQVAQALQSNFLNLANTKINVHISAILNVQGTLAISHYSE